MVADILEMHDIETRIDGETLEIAMGEVPALGIVRVMVHEESIPNARHLVDDFFKENPNESGGQNEARHPGIITRLIESIRRFFLSLVNRN